MKEQIFILEKNLWACQKIFQKLPTKTHVRKRAWQYRDHLENTNGENNKLQQSRCGRQINWSYNCGDNKSAREHSLSKASNFSIINANAGSKESNATKQICDQQQTKN